MRATIAGVAFHDDLPAHLAVVKVKAGGRIQRTIAQYDKYKVGQEVTWYPHESLHPNGHVVLQRWVHGVWSQGEIEPSET